MKASNGRRAEQRKSSARRDAAAGYGWPCGRGRAHGGRRKAPTVRRFARLLVLLGGLPLQVLAADANGLYGLAQLPGTTSSVALGVSADGSTVVGYFSPGIGQRPLFWPSDGGPVEIPTLLNYGAANAISADGKVIVGMDLYLGVRWIDGHEYILPDHFAPGTDPYNIPNAVSADGKVIVGWTGSSPYENTQAFRWVAGPNVASDGTQQLLGTLDGSHRFNVSDPGSTYTYGFTTSTATGVSRDGNVVVGWAGAASGFEGSAYVERDRAPIAFVWRQTPDAPSGEGQMRSLGTLYSAPASGGPKTDGLSYAHGVSSDGHVVVGGSQSVTVESRAMYYNAYRGEAVRWDVSWDSNNQIQSQIHSLGTLCSSDTCYSDANAVNRDGTVIVGRAGSSVVGIGQQGFRWTAKTGMQTVEQWLAASGVKVSPSLHTFSANAVNDNGDVVVGQLQDANGQGGVAFYARGGFGLIDPGDFRRTLIASAYPHVVLANTQSDMVLHGAHGSPLRGLLKGGQQDVAVSGDWGRQDHGSTQGDIGAGEVGYARGLSDSVMVRLALGRSYSVNQAPYGGFTSIAGTYVVPEIVAALPGTSIFASATGYYNWGVAHVQRAWVNTGVLYASSGEPSADASGLRLRLDGKDLLSLDTTRFTPYTSFTWMQSRIAAYGENTGGFPARWNSRSEFTTQARFGFDAVRPLNEKVDLLARVEGVHRFQKVSSGATGEVPDAAIIGAFQFPGIQYKQDWMRVGFGLEGKVGPGVASAMVNVTTEADTPSAWVYASYRMSF